MAPLPELRDYLRQGEWDVPEVELSLQSDVHVGDVLLRDAKNWRVAIVGEANTTCLGLGDSVASAGAVLSERRPSRWVALHLQKSSLSTFGLDIAASSEASDAAIVIQELRVDMLSIAALRQGYQALPNASRVCFDALRERGGLVLVTGILVATRYTLYLLDRNGRVVPPESSTIRILGAGTVLTLDDGLLVSDAQTVLGVRWVPLDAIRLTGEQR